MEIFSPEYDLFKQPMVQYFKPIDSDDNITLPREILVFTHRLSGVEVMSGDLISINGKIQSDF